MGSSMFTLPVLTILFFINLALIYLCTYIKNGKKFCGTIPFFISGIFTIFIQLLIEQNSEPGNAVILTKLQYLGFWTYFLTVPLLVTSLTEEKFNPLIEVICSVITIMTWFLTLSTDLIITSKPYLYSASYSARIGSLYPYFCTLLFFVCIYYYSKMIDFVSGLKYPDEMRYIIPIGLGICILSGIFDYAGRLKGAPLTPWLKDAFSIGMLSISLSFGIFIMFSYSQTMLEYQKALNELEKLLKKNTQNFNEFVQLIAKTIDAKDKYTAGHSMRVAKYALRIGRTFNLDERQLEILEKACLLHDIGKIGIPDGVLNKKSPLTPKDRAYIYNHPKLGKEILSQMSDFQEILDIIYFHHERYDGSGYPDGRKKDEIPLLARILAVADAYDAMLSERSYRMAKTKLEAIKELLNEKGRQFDPEIVEKFVDIIANSSINFSSDYTSY
ncbi:MAG: HD-GYP domain-containing protein [candidate division WOR-3 bacterium]